MGLNSTTSQVENRLGQPHGGRQHLERDVAHLSGQGTWQHHGSPCDSTFPHFFPFFFRHPIRGAQSFFPLELRSVSILYVLHIHRAARNWDLPTTPIPAPFPTTPPADSGCSWVGRTHLGVAVSVSYAKLPCLFPLRLTTGKAGAGVPPSTPQAVLLCGAPSTAYWGEPGTHVKNSLLTLLLTLFLSDPLQYLIINSYAVPQQHRDFMLLIFPIFFSKAKSPSISYWKWNGDSTAYTAGDSDHQCTETDLSSRFLMP